MALIAASFTLAVALVFGWAHTTLFNSREFSARATELLDSGAVRSALAERIADQIIRTGPSSLVSYRSVIVIVIEGVTQTDAFKEVFKRAVRSAHDAVFTADGDSVVLNLVDSMQVIRGTLEVVSPDAARQIPTDVGDLIVDLTNEVRGLELWKVGEDLDELVGMLFIGAFAGFAVSIAMAIDRRRAVIALGCGLVVSCALVLLTVALARHFVVGAVSDPELRPALGATFDIVTADLRSSVIWLAGYGVLIAAVANTSSSRERRLSLATARGWLQEHVLLTPETMNRRVLRGAAMLLVGLLVVSNTGLVLTALTFLGGALLAYLGATELLAVVGRTTPVEEESSEPDSVVIEAGRGRAGIRWAPFVATAGALVVFVSVGAAMTRASAIAAAREASELRCNGHAELCDRRLNEVVFASTHNSMSAARERGWLFGEHLGGIRAQLEFGIRGFLIDTHYGVPSGISVPGSDIEIVLTDKAAEVNRDKLSEQLSADETNKANELARRAGSVTGKPRDVYLCHNFCELGATRFSDALHEFEKFLQANPNEVLILFIEDYVTTAETAEKFIEVGLADRVWTHAPGEPWPTLREMIESRRQILVLSEHQSPPPPWYHAGFEIVEETPFTFPEIAAFNCEPNRGGTGRELFLLNHWLNRGSPDIRAAREANQREVLMARVEKCRNQRGRVPTMIAVDFYDQGDLLGVVDELNGVERD